MRYGTDKVYTLQEAINQLSRCTEAACMVYTGSAQDGVPPQSSRVCTPWDDMHPLQALFHGKPIVAMPFFADQLPNAEKVVAKVRQYATYSW